MSGLTVAEVLDRAADLIEPEGRWTQGSYARDLFGAELGDGRNPVAECWCSIGALEHVSGRTVPSDLVAPVWKVLGLTNHPSIVDWNDDPARTQAEVVATLRSAAAAAREVQS